MRRLVGILVAIVASAVTAVPASAAPGDFDTSWSNIGAAYAQLGQDASPTSTSTAIALAPDGKVVAVGIATDASGKTNAAVIRYNQNGTPDFSFGPAGNGIVLTQFGQGASQSSTIFFNGVVVQPDGKIVVSGYASDSSGQDQVLVARYTTSGQLDSTFAAGGKFTQQFGEGGTPASQGAGVALAPDGKIVFVGNATETPGHNQTLAGRLTADGGLDPTFGAGGVRKRQFGLSATPTSNFVAVLVLPDGSPVAAGYASDSNDDNAFLIAKLSSSGNVDPTFGAGGGTVTQLGQNPTPTISQAYSLSRQGDRFIVNGGAADPAGNQGYGMARYTAGGGLDPTFGSGGKVVRQFAATSNSIAFDSVVQPNGRIVLTGGATSIGSQAEYLIARFMPDGALDPSFGNGGVVQRQFGLTGTPLQSIATGGVWQADGKLTMAGVASDNGSNKLQFLTTRLIATTPPTAAFNAPSSGTPGQALGFDASPSTDADGSIAGASWDFGDGGKADGMNVTHAYGTPGTFTVTLTVADDNAVTATTSKTVTITKAPVALLSALKFSPASFPAASKGASFARKTGSKVSYNSTLAATTRFTVQRATKGIKKGKSCKKAKKGAKGKACTLYVAVKGSFTRPTAAGANSFKFTGRMGGKKLKPAKYRLVAQPSSAGGKGAKKTAKFKIIK
jgi:uncharacterized delta-60 repeat protein